MASKLAAFGMLVVKGMCAITVFFAFVFTIFAIGPALETKYWPVTSKLEITEMKELPGGKTEIRAAFRKLRACEYIGVAWYIGARPDDFQRVSVVLMHDENDTSGPDRPVGYQRAGPWIIGMTPEELRGKAFAQLTHRCHPFWPTTTDFFP